jgi:hypothetical protein
LHTHWQACGRDRARTCDLAVVSELDGSSCLPAGSLADLGIRCPSVTVVVRLTWRCAGPVRSFHALRHTAATLLLLEGEHPKVVHELLGHAQVSITLDRYSHMTPG